MTSDLWLDIAKQHFYRTVRYMNIITFGIKQNKSENTGK